MPQYMYRIQPVRNDMLAKGANDEEKRIVSEHFNYLQDLERKGTLILAGRTQNTDNSSHGIVIYNAESEDRAREIMLSDPAVKKFLFRAELYPYRISLLKEENAKQ